MHLHLLHLYTFQIILKYRMKKTMIFLIFLIFPIMTLLLLLLLHLNQFQNLSLISPDVVIVPETLQENGGRSDTHLHRLMILMMN